MKIKKEAALPLTAELPFRLGKDEMNLIEHPFGLLKRGDEAELYLEWEKVHPRSGKKFKASWRVMTNEKLGLPGPPEERLYLVLMELSRGQGLAAESDVLAQRCFAAPGHVKK